MMEYYFIKPVEFYDKVDCISDFLANSTKPVVIWISGPACVGKTSLSIELCHLLGIRNYISTDLTRILLSSSLGSPNIYEFLSHECWKIVGDYSKTNLIQGFKIQSLEICSQLDCYFKDIRRHRKHTIIEGVHLFPEAFESYKARYLDLVFINVCIVSSFDFFVENLLRNRTISSYRHRSYDQYSEKRLQNFKVFMDMWEDEIKKSHITEIFNTGPQTELVKNVLEKINNEITQI